MSLPSYAVDFRGYPACPCLAEWLPVYEAELLRRGVIKYNIDIAQLIGGAAASGGTHASGGAYDLWQHDATSIEVARQMGAIAWERTPAQGFPYHQHGVLRNCPHNGPARYQIDACLGGYNGLGSGGRGGRDDGPRPLPDRGWKEGIAWAKAQAKPPKPEPRRLTLASFNVERGRSAAVVLHELLALFEKHGLDGAALQEAEGYFQPLSRLKGLQWHADPEFPENGILVPAGRADDFLAADYGDGWTRQGGAQRGPGVFPRVTIDGWCRVASIHYPPSTTWPNGQLQTPDARRDDVIDIAGKAQAFLQRDNMTRVICGDLNEVPETDGQYSPGWVAKQAGATIAAPKSREGHGRIDWAMVVRGRLEHVRKDTEIREGSDHEPVVFDVVES